MFSAQILPFWTQIYNLNIAFFTILIEIDYLLKNDY